MNFTIGAVSEPGAVSLSNDGSWLSLPQAVIVEARRDIELARDLTAETPVLLIIKANQRVARGSVIPQDVSLDEEQWSKRLAEAKAKMRAGNEYLEAQQRVHRRLIAGVRTKARRKPSGPYEGVDPVEYISAELQQLDVIDQRTGTVILFDLLINAVDFVENLTGKPISRPMTASSHPPGQMPGGSSQHVDKWECTGDPVPKLIDWARKKWGEGSENLPNRAALLKLFRDQYGPVRGVNEKTMREVRRQLASPAAQRGGARGNRR